MKSLLRDIAKCLARSRGGAESRPLKSRGVSRARGRFVRGGLDGGSVPKMLSSSEEELDFVEASGEAFSEREVAGEVERRERVVEPLLMVSWRSGGRMETPSSRVSCEGEPWKKLLAVLLLAR